MEGQVYVTVEADEVTPMLMNAVQSGLNGETTIYYDGFYKLNWETPGGVTGGGWPKGYIEGNTPNEIGNNLWNQVNEKYPMNTQSRTEYINSLLPNCGKPW